MIEKGFPDFHRSNLCKFSSSIHILISRDQTGRSDRCHLVSDSAQLHMSCRWISNTMGPVAILFWCGMLMDPKIRLRSCTDPCAAGSIMFHLATQDSRPATNHVRLCKRLLLNQSKSWNVLKSSKIPQFLLVSTTKQTSAPGAALSWTSSGRSWAASPAAPRCPRRPRRRGWWCCRGPRFAPLGGRDAPGGQVPWMAWWHSRTNSKIVKYTVYSEVLEVLCIL